MSYVLQNAGSDYLLKLAQKAKVVFDIIAKLLGDKSFIFTDRLVCSFPRVR